MKSNYSVFDQNVMHSFEGTADCPESLEIGILTYLRGRETKDRLSAERAALDAIRLWSPLRYMVEKAAESFEAIERIKADVIGFIQERSYRRHFPGN